MDDDYGRAMAGPFNPADYLLDPRLAFPPPPVTGANGAPGADSNDEGPNKSDQWEEIEPYAAPNHPSVGRAYNWYRTIAMQC